MFFRTLGMPLIEVYGHDRDPRGMVTGQRPRTCSSGTVGPPSTGAESARRQTANCWSAAAWCSRAITRIPEATRRTVIDGWLHTGDVAEWDGQRGSSTA